MIEADSSAGSPDVLGTSEGIGGRDISAAERGHVAMLETVPNPYALLAYQTIGGMLERRGAGQTVRAGQLVYHAFDRGTIPTAEFRMFTEALRIDPRLKSLGPGEYELVSYIFGGDEATLAERSTTEVQVVAKSSLKEMIDAWRNSAPQEISKKPSRKRPHFKKDTIISGSGQDESLEAADEPIPSL